MILTAILGGFVKRGPRIKFYWDYKSYKSDIFIHNIVANVLPRLPQKLVFGSFEEFINSIFQKHIPIKKKYVGANDGAFMNKELRKAIMQIQQDQNGRKFQCIQNTKKQICEDI